MVHFPALPCPARLVILFSTPFIALAMLAICSTNAVGQSNVEERNSPLRVMSFNIRLGVAKDGENEWAKRKDLVVRTIADFGADVIGTQETYRFQADYLKENLSDYTYVGRSRQSDGKGEECGVLFRSARFDKLTEGHFWLSENSDQPGSKSWDSSLPRMATWLKLWDRKCGRAFYLLNTHFDHRGKVARVESARLISRFVKSLPAGSDVVVTGDFNAGEKSGPYNALFQESQSLVDTFRVLNPTPGNGEGTFNGFNGKDDGQRIDWIAASVGWNVLSATIDKSEFEGRYPSDHFPVTAVLEFPGLAQ